MWVPVFKVSSPVEPLWPTSSALASVVLSICRSNLPGSVVGLSAFLTSSLPASRVFVITQTMSEPLVTLTFSGPALSAAALATTAPVPLSARHSIDFW